jgi:hypothetical protein
MLLRERNQSRKRVLPHLTIPGWVYYGRFNKLWWIFGFQMFYGIRFRRFYQHTPAVRKVADQGDTCEASWMQFSTAYGLGVNRKLFLVVLHLAAQRISIFGNGLNSLSSMQFGNFLYRNMMIWLGLIEVGKAQIARRQNHRLTMKKRSKIQRTGASEVRKDLWLRKRLEF